MQVTGDRAAPRLLCSLPEYRRALLVDDLFALAQRVLGREFGAWEAVGAHEAVLPHRAVDLLRNDAAGLILPFLGKGRGTNRKALVLGRLADDFGLART